MRYVSIDIETLGLKPQEHDIVEFAAVLDDFSDRKSLDQLPVFHRFIYNERDLYRGSAYAMAMHHRIFEKLANRQKEPYGDIRKSYPYGTVSINDFCTKNTLLLSFYNWLVLDQGFKVDAGILRVQVAGKNFASFDRRFLEEQCSLGYALGIGCPNERLEFGHRVLDPGMLYFNPSMDNAVPSMSECQQRAGLSNVVAHTAMDDAMMVVQLLRNKL